MTDGTGQTRAPSGPVRNRGCPMCGKPRDADFVPFCSRGCRDRDLLTWFGEGYRVPAAGEPDHADADSDGRAGGDGGGSSGGDGGD